MRGMRVGGTWRHPKTYNEIAELYGVDYSTVVYHLDERQRQNTLKRARKALRRNGKKPKTDERKKYDTLYYKERYWSDPQFRLKVIRANNGFKFKED